MMTTPTPTLAAFTLSAREGRTPQSLNILGTEVLVKLADTDTHGAAAIFHQIVPPLSGPPLHRHSYEDEWFYVLNGEITIEVDGERSVLSAGSSAFVPRGTAHTFQNFHNSPAEMLAIATPGRFNLFSQEIASLNAGRSLPDMEGTERLMNDYGIDLLGPPLL
jgi:mannose-6-phosphate isomerase-like protein (cupin superfamily)